MGPVDGKVTVVVGIVGGGQGTTMRRWVCTVVGVCVTVVALGLGVDVDGCDGVAVLGFDAVVVGGDVDDGLAVVELGAAVVGGVEVGDVVDVVDVVVVDAVVVDVGAAVEVGDAVDAASGAYTDRKAVRAVGKLPSLIFEA